MSQGYGRGLARSGNKISCSVIKQGNEAVSTESCLYVTKVGAAASG